MTISRVQGIANIRLVFKPVAAIVDFPVNDIAGDTVILFCPAAGY